MKLLDKLLGREKNKDKSSTKTATTDSTSNGSFSNAAQRPYKNQSFGRRPSKDHTLQLPDEILLRIFALVCPHSRDESYQTCEQASPDEGCCLCDMRDLSRCGQVSKRWSVLVPRLLYNSIRIDAVHYCPLEAILSDKRRYHKYDKNANPENVGEKRLQLLCDTIRSYKPDYGKLVLYFKTPYMLRKTRMTDIAKVIAGMPNLRYLDLPDELFENKESARILRQVVEARCTKVRKLSFWHGSENALAKLPSGRAWFKLESLDLEHLVLDPIHIRNALGSLPNLKALKVTGLNNVDDSLFLEDQSIPTFPALEELILEEMPHVTASGIVTYLSDPFVQASLMTLSFCETGVVPAQLHRITALAVNLTKLSIIETISHAFNAPSALSPTTPTFSINSLSSPSKSKIPQLQSATLQVLNYEILAAPSKNRYSAIEPLTAGYYTYLSQSLLGGGLPELRTLYVRSETFPESLIMLPPPPLPFGRAQNRLSSNNPFAPQNRLPQAEEVQMTPVALRPFNHALEVFTKAPSSSEWAFNKMEDALPPVPDRRFSGHGPMFPSAAGFGLGTPPTFATSQRPLSSYGLSSTEKGDDWAGGIVGGMLGSNLHAWAGIGGDEEMGGNSPVLRSVIVGDGRGSFLTVTDAPERPRTAGTLTSGGATVQRSEWPSSAEEEKRSSRYDIWR